MGNHNIWYDIFQILDRKTKISVSVTSKYCFENLKINDLLDVDIYHIHLFNDDVLANCIFSNVRSVKISDGYRKGHNQKIRNISFMKKLRILDLDTSNINDDTIRGLDLQQLKIFGKTQINIAMRNLKKLQLLHTYHEQTDINGLDLAELSCTNSLLNDFTHMKNLKKLSLTCCIYVSQSSIQGLDLVELELDITPGIDNLNFMRNLKKLHIYDSAIAQTAIVSLDLYWLSFDTDCGITDISFMANLKYLELIVEDNHPIKNDILKPLQLIELKIVNNNCVTDLSFMTSLKYLNIGRPQHANCLTQTGIQGLDLYKLKLSGRHSIYDVSFMANLQELDVSGGNILTEMQTFRLTNITSLNIKNNNSITTVAHMKNLKKLICNTKICQQDIAGLDLVELSASNNFNIYDANIFPNLKILKVPNLTGISQAGISLCNLYKLNAANNYNIIDVSFMTRLKKLNASDGCGIDQAGITGLQLYELSICGNNKITDVSFMKNLVKIYRS